MERPGEPLKSHPARVTCETTGARAAQVTYGYEVTPMRAGLGRAGNLGVNE